MIRACEDRHWPQLQAIYDLPKPDDLNGLWTRGPSPCRRKTAGCTSTPSRWRYGPSKRRAASRVLWAGRRTWPPGSSSFPTFEGRDRTQPHGQAVGEPWGAPLQTAIDRPGLADIASVLEDVERACKAVLTAGGGEIGQDVSLDIPDAGRVPFAYLREPEENIIEPQH
jgi:hypothetical protein